MKNLKAKGLHALIPIKPKFKPKRKKENVFYVEIRKIRQTPEMLKREISKKALKELAESVRKYGIIQPLTVAKIEKKKKSGINVYYELISGQKRLIAAKSAGLRVVPAMIKNPPSLKLPTPPKQLRLRRPGRRTKRNDKI